MGCGQGYTGKASARTGPGRICRVLLRRCIGFGRSDSLPPSPARMITICSTIANTGWERRSATRAEAMKASNRSLYRQEEAEYGVTLEADGRRLTLDINESGW